MDFEGQDFAGQTIRIDGNRYQNCTFGTATLEYGGGELPRFASCTFLGTNFLFADAAERTIQFLRSLRAQGPLGADVVEQLLAAHFIDS